MASENVIAACGVLPLAGVEFSPDAELGVPPAIGCIPRARVGVSKGSFERILVRGGCSCCCPRSCSSDVPVESRRSVFIS